MFLKITGAVMLICGGGCLGMLFGMKSELRKRDLEELKRALLLMYSDTEFGHSYLSDMCGRAARICEQGIAVIFSAFTEYLQERKSEDISEMWAKSVEDSLRYNNLAREDVRAVSAMGSSLGTSDINRQLRAISELLGYIELKCRDIAQISGKNMRLYKNTGILLGMFAVILLF